MILRWPSELFKKSPPQYRCLKTETFLLGNVDIFDLVTSFKSYHSWWYFEQISRKQFFVKLRIGGFSWKIRGKMPYTFLKSVKLSNASTPILLRITTLKLKLLKAIKNSTSCFIDQNISLRIFKFGLQKYSVVRIWRFWRKSYIKMKKEIVRTNFLELS